MTYKTGKKERIIALLRTGSGKSYTLSDICDAVAEDGHGRSTVYRLVSELVAEGVLRRLSDGRTRHCAYQYVGGEGCREHLHLRCKGCGRLFHLDCETTREVRECILSAGLLLDLGELLVGSCPDCRIG